MREWNCRFTSLFNDCETNPKLAFMYAITFGFSKYIRIFFLFLFVFLFFFFHLFFSVWFFVFSGFSFGSLFFFSSCPHRFFLFYFLNRAVHYCWKPNNSWIRFVLLPQSMLTKKEKKVPVFSLVSSSIDRRHRRCHTIWIREKTIYKEEKMRSK